MVLAPIEPVAPSNVTLRAARAGEACVRAFGAAAIIGSPYEQSLRRGVSAGAQHTEYRADEGGGKKSIQPIHQAAVTGDQMARVFDLEFTLDGGFAEVSQLRHDG